MLVSRPSSAVVNVLRRLGSLSAVGLGLLFSCMGALSCGSTTPHATAPHVEVEPEAVGHGTFAVALNGASDEKVCAALQPFADFCVTGLASALRSGTHAVLAQFVQKDHSGPRYAASFRVLGLSQYASVHGAGDFDRPKVSLRWSFELRDDSGSRLLRLAESSNRTLMDPRAGDDAVQALMEDVLETVAEGLDRVDWQGSERRSARLRARKAPKTAPPLETAPVTETPTPEPPPSAAPSASSSAPPPEGTETAVPASEPEGESIESALPPAPPAEQGDGSSPRTQ